VRDGYAEADSNVVHLDRVHPADVTLSSTKSAVRTERLLQRWILVRDFPKYPLKYFRYPLVHNQRIC